MAYSKYTVEADLFKIEGKDFTFEVSSPSYVKEDIQYDISPLLDDQILRDNMLQHQYVIKDKDGNKTLWKLYVSPDNLFVASYHNSAYGSEVIWEIAKLSK